MVLNGLKPEKVFEYFELLCSVPHGSGNTKQISDLCVKFAEERGLKFRQDEYNNLIILRNFHVISNLFPIKSSEITNFVHFVDYVQFTFCSFVR